MNEIGFIPFDIVDNHYMNGFNMNVDLLFINVKTNFYNKIKETPIIHSVMLSCWERDHVINYIAARYIRSQNFQDMKNLSNLE